MNRIFIMLHQTFLNQEQKQLKKFKKLMYSLGLHLKHLMIKKNIPMIGHRKAANQEALKTVADHQLIFLLQK